MQTTLKQTVPSTTSFSGEPFDPSCELLEPLWRRQRHYLNDAIERARGLYTEADIHRLILLGDMQFWTGKQAAAVTEITSYPQCRVLRFVLAGGDIEDIKAWEPKIVEWARGLGCTQVEIFGRPGWERIFKDYQRLCVVLLKDIGHE
jgi:hypothetical protein